MFFKGLQIGFFSSKIKSYMDIFYLNQKLLPCEKNRRFRIQDVRYDIEMCDVPCFYSGRLGLLIFSSSKFFGFFPLNSAALMFLKCYIFVVRTYPYSSCTYVSVCCVILVDHHALVVFLALLSFYDSLGAE